MSAGPDPGGGGDTGSSVSALARGNPGETRKGRGGGGGGVSGHRRGGENGAGWGQGAGQGGAPRTGVRGGRQTEGRRREGRPGSPADTGGGGRLGGFWGGGQRLSPCRGPAAPRPYLHRGRAASPAGPPARTKAAPGAGGCVSPGGGGGDRRCSTGGVVLSAGAARGGRAAWDPAAGMRLTPPKQQRACG